MKFISRRIHGIADYLVIVIFLSLPTALALAGAPRALSYAMAFAHLLVTGFSSFPPGAFPILSVRVHKAIELVAGVFLIVSPWLFRFSDSPSARKSFPILGVALISLALLTAFERRNRAVPPPPGDRRRKYFRRG